MVVSEDESFCRTLQNNMLWYVGNVNDLKNGNLSNKVCTKVVQIHYF